MTRVKIIFLRDKVYVLIKSSLLNKIHVFWLIN